jgi:hypothetical protein
MAGTPMPASTITPRPTATGHRREESSAMWGFTAAGAGVAGLAGLAGFGSDAGSGAGTGDTSVAPHRWQFCRSGWFLVPQPPQMSGRST